MQIGEWKLKEPGAPATAPVVPVTALPTSKWRSGLFNGDKYPGGFGPTELLTADYWTLRHRSAQLFRTNLYARGILRRFITSIIATGLQLEARPEEQVLGLEEGALDDWSEAIETRFTLWGKQPERCDFHELRSWGALQKSAKLESYIDGDCLIVLRADARTGLPRAQLIGGNKVQTPLKNKPRQGNRITHGVELDKQGRQVAYHVEQEDGTSRRIPAWGEKSGRRIAWLVYGTERRVDAVRGEPVLSIVLQSLREIDRYRDSTQLKATLNAILAMFIKRETAGPKTSLAGGAVRRGVDTALDTTGETRSFNVAEFNPGLVLDMLQPGEEPVGFMPHGTDEKFGEFEEAIVQAMAWHFEIPPEILRLAFSSNYSASQAANNEYMVFVLRERDAWGEEFCHRIYAEWLVAEALQQNVDAPGLLDAWRDPKRYAEFGARVASEWSGHIKPSTDILKQTKGIAMQLEHGLITHARAARLTTGTKWSKNMKVLRREMELKNEILPPPKATTTGPDGLSLVDNDQAEDDEREAG